MKLMVLGLFGLACMFVAACANLKDPATTIVSTVAAYSAALAAENAYLASGHADPEIVRQLANARNGVASVLDPIAEATAKGNPPNSNQVLAAQVALASFQSALQANGLMPKISTGSN